MESRKDKVRVSFEPIRTWNGLEETSTKFGVVLDIPTTEDELEEMGVALGVLFTNTMRWYLPGVADLRIKEEVRDEF